MLISFLDLLRSSLRCITDLGWGEAPGPSKQADALFILNTYLDELNIDPLAAPWTLIQRFNLTAGKQTYTWGPGQSDFRGPRPNRIIDANLILLTNPQQPLRRPLRGLNDNQYAAIKLQGIGTTIPEFFYLSRTYPVAQLSLWPFPTAAYQVEFFTTEQIPFVPTVESSIDMPPGWANLLRYNWAVRLFAEWRKELPPNAQLHPLITDLASKALMMVQSQNADTPQMEVDSAIFSDSQFAGSGYFNRYTGDNE